MVIFGGIGTLKCLDAGIMDVVLHAKVMFIQKITTHQTNSRNLIELLLLVKQ